MKNIIAVGFYLHLETWKSGDKLWAKWIEKDDEYKHVIKDLNPEEEILPAGEYHLVINYPLSRSYKESITFSNPVKRKEIAEIIVNAYNKIYKVEDKTSKRSISHIPGMLNRVHTDGDYGIWGHDLGDLYLHSIYVDENNVITCSVDS